MKTYMLSFDPSTGWQVLCKDEWGNINPIAPPAPTLEYALQEAASATGGPVLIQLVTRHD